MLVLEDALKVLSAVTNPKDWFLWFSKIQSPNASLVNKHLVIVVGVVVVVLFILFLYREKY